MQEGNQLFGARVLKRPRGVAATSELPVVRVVQPVVLFLTGSVSTSFLNVNGSTMSTEYLLSRDTTAWQKLLFDRSLQCIKNDQFDL